MMEGTEDDAPAGRQSFEQSSANCRSRNIPAARRGENSGGADELLAFTLPYLPYNIFEAVLVDHMNSLELILWSHLACFL